jgi:hypothetical protein
MTLSEFSAHRWGANMQAEYKGETYEIAAVDFEEKLLGLCGVVEGADEDERTWVRCENATILPRPEGLPNDRTLATQPAPQMPDSK